MSTLKCGTLTYCILKAEGIWEMAGDLLSPEVGHKTLIWPVPPLERDFLISKDRGRPQDATTTPFLSYHICPPLSSLH